MARIVLLFLLLISSVNLVRAQDENLNIAIAANLLPAMSQIEALYEEKFQSSLTLIVASSGKLTAQIINGAPYDVFISADMKYPAKVYSAGNGQQTPDVLIQGKLAFWTKEPSVHSIEEGLQQAKTIAIAQPELAPYGYQTQQWLQAQGWWEQVQSKLVYAENVSQVNQYIATGAVDAAFTANSAQYTEAVGRKGKWKTVPEATLLPHGMVLLQNSEAPEYTVNQFLEFIISPVAQKVFQDFGYALP
ncbi:MAG: molybdate ABC transporter substrate-binding protein [Cyclobacteriaceae bacterium]|mgnify:CR=1 FL=1